MMCTFLNIKNRNHCHFTDVVFEMEDYKFSDVSWGVIFVPFSEKLTYKKYLDQNISPSNQR